MPAVVIVSKVLGSRRVFAVASRGENEGVRIVRLEPGRIPAEAVWHEEGDEARGFSYQQEADGGRLALTWRNGVGEPVTLTRVGFVPDPGHDWRKRGGTGSDYFVLATEAEALVMTIRAPVEPGSDVLTAPVLGEPEPQQQWRFLPLPRTLELSPEAVEALAAGGVDAA